MKRKFKNITIPYRYYDKKKNLWGYYYQNKFWTNLNDLFCEFVGSYLNYHYQINGMLKVGHSMEDIVGNLVQFPDSFDIPRRYMTEYNKMELNYLFGLKEKIINHQLEKPLECDRTWTFRERLRNFKYYRYTKEMKQYQNEEYPKKVYSKVFEQYCYVLKGEEYGTLTSLLSKIYSGGFYYQFGGDGIEDSFKHDHCHDWESVVFSIFSSFDEFKIYDYQKQFFSQQQLDFVKHLCSILKEKNYHSIDYFWKHNVGLEYLEQRRMLKEKKKYISLFFLYGKMDREIIRRKKLDLKNHKI